MFKDKIMLYVTKGGTYITHLSDEDWLVFEMNLYVTVHLNGIVGSNLIWQLYIVGLSYLLEYVCFGFGLYQQGSHLGTYICTIHNSMHYFLDQSSCALLGQINNEY